MATEIKKPEGAFFKEPRKFGPRFQNGFPVGKRTKERQRQNAKLRNLGIRHCELGISPYCSKTSGLTWSHSRKSRFLVTPKDWQEAARCCAACHDLLDNHMGHAEMAKRVRDAISRRKNQ